MFYVNLYSQSKIENKIISWSNKLKSIILFLFIFFTNMNVILGNDIDKLVEDFPSVITKFSSLDPSLTSKKIVWSRTDLTKFFPETFLSVKGDQLLINEIPVNFLTSEQSQQDYPDFYSRKVSLPLVVYKWEMEVDVEGQYLLSLPAESGASGYLNGEPVLLLSNGIFSVKKSGKQQVKLLKGKNILYLTAKPGYSTQLNYVSIGNIEKIRNAIQKKFDSNSNEDYQWSLNVFLPYVCSLQNGCSSHFIKLLAKLNSVKAIEKTPEMSSLLRSYCNQQNRESYLIEKYIYQNLPDHYFLISKVSEQKAAPLNSFILSKNLARTQFLQQLIYDGQRQLANQYFEKCIEVIKNNNSSPDKENIVMGFYADRFSYLLRIGRTKDASEVFETNKEICKNENYQNYMENKPDQEDAICLTQSYDETVAFQMKEKMTDYDGGQGQLAAIYKLYISLNKNLVKDKYGAISLLNLFQQYKSLNQKLNEDFNKYHLEKIQSLIDKAKENRDINLIEDLITQNEILIPMPDLRVILLEEYFKNGYFLKALSHAHYLFEKYPQYLTSYISKMVLLENIAEYTNSYKKVLKEKELNSEIKILGQPVLLAKVRGSLETGSQKLGKFLQTIPLVSSHIQYWDHPQINFYQPIEPIFTKNQILFNGGNYLTSYSIKENKLGWVFQSNLEYKKNNEDGPHQKRFITTHSGNQLFMLTNRDFSSTKTVKSFDLKGNLLWDISDQKSSIEEEPICTPIESQGKLFCLTQRNREAINTIAFCTYDTCDGKLISKTPISIVPKNLSDSGNRGTRANWNTFTHDNHFITDESFVFGYTGTGVLFKADAITGTLLWAKGFPRSNTNTPTTYFEESSYSPSGFIRVYDNVIVSFMPDVQMFKALNKNSSEYIWETNFYRPKYIHDRENASYLFFSSETARNEPVLYKVNPKNGETIWQMPTNGLAITGEGVILNKRLYIPSDKSILVINEDTGSIIEQINLKIQPLKIRCSDENIVIFSSYAAYIFDTKGTFDPSLMKESMPVVKSNKFIEPDTIPSKHVSFENISLEVTLKIPETFFTSGAPVKLIKTSKPFHFLIKSEEHMMLIREGFSMKDGRLCPPEILWYGQYPHSMIVEDLLIVSDYGKIIAYDIFTRAINWSYEYERGIPVFPNSLSKIKPIMTANNQFIAYYTENKTICILEFSTRKKIAEFYVSDLRNLLIDGNYLITINHKNDAKCIDILDKCKELWVQSNYQQSSIEVLNGQLVYYRNIPNTLHFYDLKTGNVTLNLKTPEKGAFNFNNMHLNDKFLFVFNLLFDGKTGAPIEKYKEVSKVTGGGYIAFFNKFGMEGNYLVDDKEYAFKTKCSRNFNNFIFAAIKKENRIVFFTTFGIETFEISGDHLESLEYISFYSRSIGNGEVGMSFLPLDESFLLLRNDEMYFFKNYDLNLNYEKIKSNRVENKKNVQWPYSEVYPEIKVDDKNWISYNGEKPKRDFSYQVFGDEKYAYLKFILSPFTTNDSKSMLYISGNGFVQIFAITWDVDNWKNCQFTMNIRDNIESWKEVDINGYTNLYIKLELTHPISRMFKSTLPDFNIELRQLSNSTMEGLFRCGGSYNKNRKFFPWMTYMNDEAQSLKDFALRSTIYENTTNFYPQGDDIVGWLKDRRRIKGVENNIKTLNKILEANAKFYCSVNILSGLLLEEIFLLKQKQPNLDEISDEFTQKVKETVIRLHKQALEKGVKKEWADYALSFWTIEVFPFKFNYARIRTDIFKAIHGYAVRNEKDILMSAQFSNVENILTPNINQPYLEWILPGLAPNFPKDKSFGSIELNGIGTSKSGLGRMILYSPTNSTEFCNRLGKFVGQGVNISSGGDEIKIVPTKYYSKGNVFDCFNVLHPKTNYIDILIKAPEIKSPAILQDAGQTPESVLQAIDNLPSDSKRGVVLVEYYLGLIGNAEDKDIFKVFGRWLSTMKSNSESLSFGLKFIYNRYSKQKNAMDLLGNIIKEAKLPPSVSRQFFLDRNNKYSDKNTRSVLGPCIQELETKPEVTFDSSLEYKGGDIKYKFTDNMDNKLGGTVYLATKITAEDAEKAYLFFRSNENGNATNKVSVYLNGNALTDNIDFLKNDDDTIMQRLQLAKGDNILLIKIVGSKESKWVDAYSFIVGDLYGCALKGIECKAFNNK